MRTISAFGAYVVHLLSSNLVRDESTLADISAKAIELGLANTSGGRFCGTDKASKAAHQKACDEHGPGCIYQDPLVPLKLRLGVRPETAALLYASGIGTMQGLRTRGSAERRHYAKELRKFRRALRTYWAPQ